MKKDCRSWHGISSQWDKQWRQEQRGKARIIGEVLELAQEDIDSSQNPRLYMNNPPGDSIRDPFIPDPGLDLSFANAFVFATYSFGRCSHLYRGFLGQSSGVGGPGKKPTGTDF